MGSLGGWATGPDKPRTAPEGQGMGFTTPPPAWNTSGCPSCIFSCSPHPLHCGSPWSLLPGVPVPWGPCFPGSCSLGSSMSRVPASRVPAAWGPCSLGSLLPGVLIPWGPRCLGFLLPRVPAAWCPQCLGSLLPRGPCSLGAQKEAGLSPDSAAVGATLTALPWAQVPPP